MVADMIHVCIYWLLGGVLSLGFVVCYFGVYLVLFGFVILIAGVHCCLWLLDCCLLGFGFVCLVVVFWFVFVVWVVCVDYSVLLLEGCWFVVGV